MGKQNDTNLQMFGTNFVSIGWEGWAVLEKKGFQRSPPFQKLSRPSSPEPTSIIFMVKCSLGGVVISTLNSDFEIGLLGLRAHTLLLEKNEDCQPKWGCFLNRFSGTYPDIGYNCFVNVNKTSLIGFVPTLSPHNNTHADRERDMLKPLFGLMGLSNGYFLKKLNIGIKINVLFRRLRQS